MAAPKPKKTLLDLAKESPPKPPPTATPSNQPSSSTPLPKQDQTPKSPTKDDVKPPSDKKSPFDKMFKKDNDSKKDSKDVPPTSDTQKALKTDDKGKGLFQKFKKNKDAKNDKNVQETKPSDVPGSQPTQEEFKPSEDKTASKDTSPKTKEPEPQPPMNDAQPLPNKETAPKPDNQPGASEDTRYPLPSSDGDSKTPEGAKSDDPKNKAEEKKPEKKKGFFGKFFGKEEPKKDEPADKLQEPLTNPAEPATKPEESLSKPDESLSKPEEIPKEMAGEIPRPPTDDPLPTSEGVPKDPLGTPENKLDAPNEGSEMKELPKDAEKDDSKYPMPVPEENTPEKETKPEGTKTETEPKKPEKKSGGFFGNLFGKEEQPVKAADEKKEEGKKGQEKPATKEPEKSSGGFFGNLFKKDKKSPTEDSIAKDKQEEKSGPDSGFDQVAEEAPKSDEGPKPVGEGEVLDEARKNSTSRKDDEEVAEFTDAEEFDDPGFVIKERIVERRKVRKPRVDIRDEFESGDAYLVAKVGTPHSKHLIADPNLYDRFGGLLTNCERTLGIIPARFAEHHEKKSDPEAIRGIYVWGLVPRGPADKAGVELGDWIIAIDEKEINSNNFQEVVKGVEHEKKIKVKLQKVLLQFDSTVKSRKSIRLSETKSIKCPATVTDLSGNSADLARTFFEDLPHCILFLKNHIRSKDLQEFDAKEDVLYCFPDIPDNNLTGFRGSFLTLQPLVPFLTNSQVESTTLEHNNRRIWVSHQPSDNGLLLIFIPSSRFSEGQLRQYSNDIKRLVELLFVSVESAFTDPSNHPKLDEMFTNVFVNLFSPGDDVSFNVKFHRSTFREEFLDSSACTRSIPVDQNLKMQVDDYLSCFEAESFGNMSEDYYGSRKVFDILGSSFYYKGYLVSSHIPYQHVQDVNVVLKYNNLLSHNNIEQMGHSYLWTEVFFRNECNISKNRTRECSMNTGSFDVFQRFESSNHRNFILALSADNSVLVALLSCGEKSSDLIGLVPCVDLFLLNRLKFTLAQLGIAGVMDSIEYFISKNGRPCLSNVEWFLKKPKSKVVEKITDKFKKLFKRNKDEQKLVVPSSQNIGASQSDLSSSRNLLVRQLSDSNLYLRNQFEESERFNDEDVVNGDPDDIWGESNFSVRRSSVENVHRTSSSKLQLNRISDILGSYSRHPFINRSPYVKINTGNHSTVFNYAFVDSTNNVIVAPPQQQIMSQASLTQSEVMKKFNESCLLIHEFFLQSPKQLGEAVLEHGILFRCSRFNFRGNNKDSDQQVDYWVVGRKVKTSHGKDAEFYACFHDSAQQNVVEMAFKLMHGTCIT